MKLRWKKIFAMLGVTAMVIIHSIAIPVMAEENQNYATKIIAEENVGEGELLPMDNLGWDEEVPGRAVFHNPNDTQVICLFSCFMNGEKNINTCVLENVLPDANCSVSTDSSILEDGTYTFQVATFPCGSEVNWDSLSDCVSEVSPVFNYSKPSIQLSVPSNIKWTTNGAVSWDGVEHAHHFIVNLYRADDDQPIVGGSPNTTSINFKNYLTDDYDYYVKVRVISENINLYANSDFSAPVAFDRAAVEDETNNKLMMRLVTMYLLNMLLLL